MVLALGMAGCSDLPASTSTGEPKPPRPVATSELQRSRPVEMSEVTGAVVSWKTERIGFEVPGRVRRVIEPNEPIEARLFGPDGKTVLGPGTPLAELDDERFRIAVQSAEAAVEVTRKQIEALRVEIDRRIPASVASAEARRNLAKTERDRARTLIERSAGTRADLDQAETQMATASADVAGAEAELASRKAELKAMEARALQDEQRLADARRDLADTTLFSSFRGQVAETHVLPGSFVQAGDPVVTVQLMDPVAVEFEVSADDSRRYRQGDTIRILSTSRAGSPRPHDGLVYRTDAVADPETRTFTVTLLVRNDRERLKPPESMLGGPVARTDDLWPLNLGDLLGDDSELFAEEGSIRQDDEGAFVWKATNRRLDEPSVGGVPVLQVEKIRVEPGPIRVPFLGNWSFVPVSIPEGQDFDPEHELIAGTLSIDGSEVDPDSWEGDAILLDRSGWLLRPGDVVRVELTGDERTPGYYAPMRAIRHEAGKAHVYVLETIPDDRAVARRVQVRLSPEDATFRRDSALHRIDPVEPGALEEGDRLIVEGVHYLRDGEEVVEVRRPGGSR